MIEQLKNIPALKLCLFIATLLLLVGAVGAAAPEAAFSGTPISGTAPLAVDFADESTGSPTGWAWFFGDESYTQAWTEQTAGAGWSGRGGFSMVAMPDSSIILMGGINGFDNTKEVYLENDTWRSTDYGNTWTLVNAHSGWPARYAHNSVVTPDGMIVLMGGMGFNENITFFNDTWQSADYGNTWTQVNTDAGWSARYFSASVAMPDGMIVLMGGRDDSGTLKNDVWQSADNGNTWTLVNANAAWSGRSVHTAVAMPDGSIILMGGWDDTSALNDIWRSADNGATWTLVNADPKWPARQAPVAVTMPDGSILLMGGYADNDNYLNDLWRSTDDGTTWTLVNANAGWPARSHQSGVAMPDGSIVLMGGQDGNSSYNDTWRLQPAGSTDPNPTHTYTAAGSYTVTLQVCNADGYTRTTRDITVTPPPPITAFSGTPTSGTAPLTVAFSDASTGATGRAWFFGDETYSQAWTEQNASSGWSKRTLHTSVAMPDGTIVLMGGWDGSSGLNDTWTSTDTGATWTLVNASAGWSKRTVHTSVVTPDGSIILMGGHDGTTYLNDTWRSTDDGATWTLVNPACGWSARAEHTSVAMPDGRIILMGGWDGSSGLNDTWTSTDTGATWTLVNASSGWLKRFGHTSVVTPDGTIVLMDGAVFDPDFEGYTGIYDVWTSRDDGATWMLVNEDSSPDPRESKPHRGTLAMPDGSILLMGGDGAMGAWNDLWRSTDDGATWTLVNEDCGWPGRTHPCSVAMPDGSIVLMGGRSLNDTWRLQPAGSTDPNPTHTYTAAGTYPVTLQTFNTGGYDTLSQTGYITVTSPARGGDDGDSDGPSIAPAAQLSTAKDVTVNGKSAVSRVNVTGTGISRLIVTGTVLSALPDGVSPAQGSVFQYIDLIPARYTNITGATVTFTVPVSWLEEQNLSPADIVMYHYNGTEWTALPTMAGNTINGQVTFTAISPGFSLYAVSGVAQTPAEPTTVPTPAETAPPATPAPTSEQTTAVPISQPAPGLPLSMIAIGGVVVLALIGGGYLVRRWWIQR